MTTFTKTIAKGGIATAAVGAMALAGANPVQARDRDRDGISAGEIIAGAIILGGIAAVASSAGRDRYRDYDDRYRYRDSYRYGGSPRSAVQRCVSAVERDARRYGYSFANVTQIRDVDDTRYGWRVKGRMEVADRGYGRYDRYSRHDRRYSGRDTGKFTCYIDRGRVRDIDYSGIRRL